MRPTPPHAGPSRDGLPGGTTSLAGRITDVDPQRWTCQVQTEILNKTLNDVLIGSGVYLHPFAGEGVYAMPEVGALVNVARSSEGDAPWHIESYRAYPLRGARSSNNATKPAAPGNRPRLAPGDIAVLGRERNGVYVRRGQLTEVLGGPLARTIYDGRSGTIRTLAQHLRTDVFAGSARWEVDRPEKDPDGKKRARADVRFKEFANDRGYVVRLQVGGGIDATFDGQSDGAEGASGPAPASLDLVTEPVVRFRVYQDGNQEEDALATALSVAFDKNGQAELALKGALVVEIRGDKNVTLRLGSDGKVSLSADSDVDVTTSTKVTQTTAGFSAKQDSDGVHVGATPTAKVLYDNQFSTDLAAFATEFLSVASSLGIPAPNTSKLVSSLALAAYTAKKLESE